MDYHHDRFIDHSYIVFKKNKVFALFPGHQKGRLLYSHLGLSYGGFLLNTNAKFENVLQAFQEVLNQIDKDGFLEIKLKVIPRLYQNIPSDEIDYLLFKLNANLIRRDITSVIENSNHIIKNSTNRIRGLKRALNNNLEIRETTDFQSFWNEILTPNLKKQFNVKPVHSVEEIELLHKKFPKNIKQFNVYYNDNVVAGCTIFESKNVAHTQYISANEKRQELGSLDFLFNYLIHTYYKDKKYFDFGISNENEGQHINQGLLLWKESFGARSMSVDFYSINVTNRHKLNTVMI